MALVKVKPTSPGRRAVVKVVNPDLHKGAPYAGLLESQSKNAGRNNNGHITTRHQGGGHKQHYRLVDFKRNKDGIPGESGAHRVRSQTARRTSPCSAMPTASAVMSSHPKGHGGWAAGAQRSEAPIKSGNALPIRNIPVGTTIHCVEMIPGKGAQLARSAGTSAQLLAREGVYAQVRLRSGEIRRVFMSSAGRRSVRWVMKSIAFAPSARPVPIAGAEFGRPCAAWP
jgi:large subunit ribosomal protein L2